MHLFQWLRNILNPSRGTPAEGGAELADATGSPAEDNCVIEAPFEMAWDVNNPPPSLPPFDGAAFADEYGAEISGLIPALRSKAEDGDVKAMFHLGHFYFMGLNGDRDYAEALKWFRLAAEGNHPGALHGLGVSYFNGRGQAENTTEGLKYFRLAADMGYNNSRFNLGQIYRLGQRGVKADAAEAAKWYQMAAQEGDEDSQYELALLYWSGNGVEANLQKAGELLLQAAEKNQVKALNFLGGASLWSLPPQYEQAAYFFQAAARLDDGESCYELAKLHTQGLGVAQDQAKAEMYYRLAEKYGFTPGN